MRVQATHTLKSASFKDKPWAGLVIPFPKPATKKEVQLLRKAWHVGMILTVMYLYADVFTTRQMALTVLSLIGLPFVFLDISRLWWKPLNKFIVSVFGPTMRKRELFSVSATTPFILSSFIVISFFPKPIALLSLACLALGDVAANIVGIKFGKDKIVEGKSLQGSLACFSVCFLLTFAFIVNYSLISEYATLICLIGGLVPTVAEIISSKTLDDNFLIPVLTASILYPVLLFFGW
ncbi:MAG: hypothetical protein A2Z91_01885 [Deltaproteobacteria bacterium GWA2_38_16]|nr:MAG: hypothetical protein A2Z91_01885 [Deltaproteobacteria bacterium GWA2_38_16]OGQ01947.1 MAG: hypothetical protein A3D19_08180 [Deltaproteobacteria bacterium RIFCSPHIGHO2_02_FULL_38_15]OGQ34939.1 MAG: hypothetical protein A3A72_06155 [Deltaproteobacteria bacterium RIFCSPLOWO2_01_FULL_38_9]OGQ63718.1 MAG: hypothetical protein A3G92_06010 [Deltaproteobacteria bacterium RIFCSPLOWO2_12_FULL_38_8]HBQ21292.1 hypothetical protein [Deltaproteobacteria bacterium]